MQLLASEGSKCELVLVHIGDILNIYYLGEIQNYRQWFEKAFTYL